MTCPDTDRLLEVVLEGKTDADCQAHVQACPECAATSRLVREMRAAYRPELHIPDEVLEARVDWIVQQLPTSSPARAESTLVDALVSGVLAFATVLLTIVGTGSVGGRGLWGPVALAVIAMLAAGLFERRAGGRVVPAP